jgi:hypothetical protein
MWDLVFHRSTNPYTFSHLKFSRPQTPSKISIYFPIRSISHYISLDNEIRVFYKPETDEYGDYDVNVAFVLTILPDFNLETEFSVKFSNFGNEEWFLIYNDNVTFTLDDGINCFNTVVEQKASICNIDKKTIENDILKFIQKSTNIFETIKTQTLQLL